MIRFVPIGLLALLLAATGCTMCQHPYDYCGATFTGDNCVPCNPYARAGSILSPQVPTASGGQYVGQTQYMGEIPDGAEVIQSDDVIFETPAEPIPAPDAQTQAPRTMAPACPQCRKPAHVAQRIR